MKGEKKYAALCALTAFYLISHFLRNSTLFSIASTRGKVTVLASAFTVGLAYLAPIVVYRSVFHPLAKYPGPFWAAASDWFLVYHCWIGDRHLELYRLHRKYGTVVRIGPNRISVNSAPALQQIYSGNANTQKSQNYTAFHHMFKVPMVATIIDRKRHSFRRRIHAQAFNGAAIRGLEDLLLANVRKFTKFLGDEKAVGEWSTPKNMTQWISYLSFDIIGTLTYSRNWNLMESEQNRNIPSVIAQGLAGLSLAGYMPIILTLRLDQILYRTLNNAKAQFRALSDGQTGWRLKQYDLESRDLFANLLEAKDPETLAALTEEELVAEAGVLIVAGGDTVTTAMTATLFNCMHHPSVLVRLQEEIRSTFGDLEGIRMGERLNSCRFLRACIDETMRVTPPVSALLPREILSGGLAVDDHHFPEGIDIGVPHYALHHNERYYEDPFLFKPDRWIVGTCPDGTTTTEASVALGNSAFCPFSVGRAGCVGKSLAYQEMLIVLARVVWLYDMRLHDRTGEGHAGLGKDRERKDEFQTWEGFVSTHDGPVIEFMRRC